MYIFNDSVIGKKYLFIPSKVCIMSTDLDNPTGYGRIIKEDDRFVKIVEEKDNWIAIYNLHISLQLFYSMCCTFFLSQKIIFSQWDEINYEEVFILFTGNVHNAKLIQARSKILSLFLQNTKTK